MGEPEFNLGPGCQSASEDTSVWVFRGEQEFSGRKEGNKEVKAWSREGAHLGAEEKLWSRWWRRMWRTLTSGLGSERRASWATRGAVDREPHGQFLGRGITEHGLFLGLPWRQWRHWLEIGRDSQRREWSDWQNQLLLRQQTQARVDLSRARRQVGVGGSMWRLLFARGEKPGTHVSGRTSLRGGSGLRSHWGSTTDNPSLIALVSGSLLLIPRVPPIQLPAWKPWSQTWFPGEPKTAGQDYMSIHAPFLNS